jgi:hypothetical protein
VNITLLTGSLESGRDGVGDYTRWLAIEAARHGVSCRAIAVADRHIDRTVEADDNDVPLLRLPYRMPWTSRVVAARRFIDAGSADWISLQFVPYSFQRWGVASTLVDILPRLIGSVRLHVMLHEIWIHGNASFKQRAISAAQRRAVLRLCRSHASVVHTSNETYRRVLADHNVRADVLPLFGSVPPQSSGAQSWLAPLLTTRGCDALAGAARDRWWLCAFFGTLHPIWPIEPLLSELEAAANDTGRRIACVAAGHLGSGETLWRRMCDEYGARMPMLRLGEQPSVRISQLFNTVDFGIATSPLALIGKSATAAAMFDHGLPVIVNREDGPFPAPPFEPRVSALVIRRGPDFEARLRGARRQTAEWRLHDVATAWLDALGPSGARSVAWSS